MSGILKLEFLRILLRNNLFLFGSCKFRIADPALGSVSFRGELRSRQASDYQKLYQTAEIRSRSAATRSTWMIRRRASETFWLM
jgi:hypothetical protein